MVSIVAGEYTDSAVVLAILVTSTGVGFWRERGARDAVARLRARLTIETEAIRGGVQRRISAADVVPGDLVVLSAGALVPADGLLWEATDLHVNEAILTGETFPAEKRIGPVDAGAPLAARINSVFMGTNVRAGTGRVLIVSTGKSTAFGEIAHRLRLRPPETEFDRGIRQFGYLLTSAMLGHGLRRLRRAHAARPAARRDVAVLGRARGRSEPGAAPRDSERQPRPGAQMMADTACSCGTSPPSRTSAAWTSSARTRRARSPKAWSCWRARTTAPGAPSADVQTLGAWNAALETGLASPLDDAILQRRGAGPVSRSKAGGDPVRLRPQACQRRRGRAKARACITKGAFDQRARHLHAICRRRALDAAGEAASRSATRPGARRASACWRSPHDARREQPATAATRSAT